MRLYLTNTPPSYTPATWKAAFASTAGAVDVKLGKAQAGANVALAITETSTTNNYKAAHLRAVSDPLGAAGTLTGAFSLGMARMESDAAANMTVFFRIYVTVGDSDTVRGTFFSDFVGGTEFPTAMTAFSFTQTGTDVAVQAGDRVVLEVGFNAANTSATAYTATIQYGGTAGDLVTPGTAGVTTNSPWVSFAAANDPLFVDYVPPSITASPASVAPSEAFGSPSISTITPTPTPGEVLNIGPNAGQNHFAVQVAPTGAGSFVTHTQAEIAAGYDEDPYFTTTAASPPAVQFWARMDAPTTSGSAYSRSELREVNADGSNIVFDALSGIHELHGRTKITHLPPNKPEVVIAQLHNGDADRISIRTQLVSGTIRLRCRINGSSVTPDFASPYVVGTEFEWKIRLVNGTAYVYFNDMTTPVITSTALVPTTHPDGWYFKTGLYNQSNETLDAATEYGSAELRDLTTYHEGSISAMPIGIASGESFGIPSASMPVTASPAGITTGEAFGAPRAAASQTYTPDGIPPAEAFGQPALAATLTASPAGIASPAAFGSPAVTVQDLRQAASPAGIASAGAFGAPNVVGNRAVSAQGIASLEAFGTPKLSSVLVTFPANMPSRGTAFGAPSIKTTLTAAPGGIATQQAVGQPSLIRVVLHVSPAGIAGLESFGVPRATGGSAATPYEMAGAMLSRRYSGRLSAPENTATTPHRWEGTLG